jgi:site-specific DNA-methyltransferase (adenine-specific)
MFIFSKGLSSCNQIKDRRNKKAGTKSIHTKREQDGTIKNMYADGRKTERGEYGVRFNVWDIYPEQSSLKRLHPAPFPEQLAHDHIISWSNEGDTVFDPMMGSGTTGKMAKQLNRNFIGIEKEPEYFEIAKQRIERETRQQKLFSPGERRPNAN